MAAMEFAPRAVIGVPDPGGRARLAPRRRYMLGHYPGVAGFDDPARDWEYARSVARYGISAGKRWEYNWLIGLGGTIFEQAGMCVAAHCATKVPDAPLRQFNPHSVGVLLMAGIGVRPTTAMIRSFRWLRWHLIGIGLVDEHHDCAPHYKFRATACPGSMLATPPGAAWMSPTGEGRLGSLIPELLEPWQPPPPPPTPQSPPTVDPEEDDMPGPAIVAVYEPSAAVTAANPKTFGLLPDGSVRHLSGPDVAYARKAGAVFESIDGDEHYGQLDALAARWRP